MTIKNKRDAEFETVETLIHRQKENAGYRMCMLIITHACNLNCSYCYEFHKCNKRMEPELAKEVILSEIALVETSNKFQKLEVHFIGGEPFMNFPLMKDIVEWLEDIKPTVPVICSCSTNGTLVDESNKQWPQTQEYATCDS